MEERYEKLDDININYGFENKDYIELEHADWSVKMSVDPEAEELIFKTIIAPNTWLAIGLADNLLNADIIQWVVEPNSNGDNDLKDLSSSQDSIAVHGVLLANIDNHLSTTVEIDDVNNKVEFTTLRAFDTQDPLDTIVKLDSTFQLSIASGSAANVEWDQKVDHGRIELFISTEKPVEPVEVERTIPIEEARIS